MKISQNFENSITRKLVIVGAVGLMLTACDSSTTAPKSDAVSQQSGDKSAVSAESPATDTMTSEDIDKIKADMEGSSGADLAAKAEELWKDEHFKGALELATLAYEKDRDRNAAYRIGSAYYGGYGVEKNIETAYKVFSEPALSDVRYAKYYRGIILGDPTFKGFDKAAARSELEAAEKLGVKEATKALSDLGQ